MSLFVVAEGDGDRDALPVLIAKVAAAQGIAGLPHVPRIRGIARHALEADRTNGRTRVECRCETYRAQASVTALLLTQDADDICPKDLAPEVSGWVRKLALPFPVAVVLFHREYETLFLAASGSLQGRPLRGAVERTGLPAGAIFHGDPEAKRGAKGWIGEQLGRRYIEAIDQAAFTRTLDFGDDRLQQLSSFRRLANGLRFLATHAGTGQRGMVYP